MCSDVTNECLSLLFTSVYSLQSVTLSCLENITASAFISLTRHSELRKLDVSRCVELDHQEFIPLLQSFPQLTALNLSWLMLRDNDLLTICQHSPLLNTINVEGCKYLSDAVLDGMGNIKSTRMYLTTINFSYCNHISLPAIIRFIELSVHPRIKIFDYYNDQHDVSTLETDKQCCGDENK